MSHSAQASHFVGDNHSWFNLSSEMGGGKRGGTKVSRGIINSTYEISGV